MEKEKQEVLIEDIVAYLYLYLPIIIFLLTWIRPVFAYPVCGILLFCGIPVFGHRRTVAITFHEKVKFENISFKPRQGGENSINLKKIIKIGWNALGDFYRLRKYIDK